MNFGFAFRLVNISSDLGILEAHLKLIEEQEKEWLLTAQHICDDLVGDLSSYSQDDSQSHWQFAQGVYDDRVEFQLPRILYYPFLVSLYAVYESAVTEIATLIQDKSGQKDSLADIRRGDFLNNARKYYRDTLNFELLQNNQSWERIRILTEIRHTIAHANGHLSMVTKKRREKIKKWIEQNIGIEDYYGDIIISGAFVRETFEIVKGELESLIKRFKDWNSTAEVQ